MRITALTTLALAVLLVPPVAGQAPDTARAPLSVAPAAQDTSGRVGPVGALLRSLVLPGWGQGAVGRHVSGALFVAWEGVTATMTLKARGEARYFERIGSPLQESKRQEVEDWLVLWIFNHLFAGVEAFVGAHLQDFPGDLELRAVPRGVVLRVPLP